MNSICQLDGAEAVEFVPPVKPRKPKKPAKQSGLSALSMGTVTRTVCDRISTGHTNVSFRLQMTQQRIALLVNLLV